MGVPVRVVENDYVGCSQVDAQTAGPGAQHEDELCAVWLVVRVDGDLMALERNRFVKSQMIPAEFPFKIHYKPDGRGSPPVPTMFL